jgi:hypothetical protein
MWKLGKKKDITGTALQMCILGSGSDPYGMFVSDQLVHTSHATEVQRVC